MDSLISVIMKERNFGRDIENLRNLIEEYQEAEKSDILKVNPNEISFTYHGWLANSTGMAIRCIGDALRENMGTILLRARQMSDSRLLEIERKIRQLCSDINNEYE